MTSIGDFSNIAGAYIRETSALHGKGGSLSRLRHFFVFKGFLDGLYQVWLVHNDPKRFIIFSCEKLEIVLDPRLLVDNAQILASIQR